MVLWLPDFLPGATWCWLFSTAVILGTSSCSAWAQPRLILMWALPRALSVCHPVLSSTAVPPKLSLAQWGPQQPIEMCDNGDPEDKPPAPPVRMSSTIFSTGSGKDSLSANHSSKPLPSVPEERKPRNKIISIFSGAEKGEKSLSEKYLNLQCRTSVITQTPLTCSWCHRFRHVPSFCSLLHCYGCYPFLLWKTNFCQKYIATREPAQECRVIYLVVISLFSIVWTCLARAQKCLHSRFNFKVIFVLLVSSVVV